MFQKVTQRLTKFNEYNTPVLYGLAFDSSKTTLISIGDTIANTLAVCDEAALDNFRHMGINPKYISKLNLVKLSVHVGRSSIHKVITDIE